MTSSTQNQTTSNNRILSKTFKLTKAMLGLLSGINVNNKISSNTKCTWMRTWTQNMKNFRKTGIKIREAMLLSLNGDKIVHEGNSLLAPSDIMKLRNILVDGDACKDVLHLENLYYCVKLLTDDMIVLFNGGYYVMACLTKSKHIIVVNVKGRKADGARTIEWIQTVAEDLNSIAYADPQGAPPYLLDWF